MIPLPFFSIESFRWLNSTEIVPIQFERKKLGSYSLDPLGTSEKPWVALIPPHDWEPSIDPTFPQAHVKEESRTLAVLVDPARLMDPNDPALSTDSNPERCRGLMSTFYF